MRPSHWYKSDRPTQKTSTGLPLPSKVDVVEAYCKHLVKPVDDGEGGQIHSGNRTSLCVAAPVNFTSSQSKSASPAVGERPANDESRSAINMRRQCAPMQAMLTRERGEPFLLPLPCGLSYANQRLGFPGPAPGACCAGSPSPRSRPFAPPAPLQIAPLCSQTSSLLRPSLTSHARSSTATVPRLPAAGYDGFPSPAKHETSRFPSKERLHMPDPMGRGIATGAPAE